MAGQTNRDVTLNIKANAVGSEGIRDMASELRSLAKSGGDAAPEFERLAVELDRVADSAAAVERMQELGAVTATTTERVIASRAAFDQAKAALDEQAAATAAAVGRQQELDAALQQARATYTEATQALRTQRAENQAATEVTNLQVQALKAARIAQADAAAEVSNARAAYQQQTKEVQAAAAAQKDLQREVNAAGKELAGAEGVARKQAAALAEATSAAERLGVSTENLAEAQSALLARQQAVVAAAQREQELQATAVARQQALTQETTALAGAAARLEQELAAEAVAQREAAAAAAQHNAELKQQSAIWAEYEQAERELQGLLADQRIASEAAAAARMEQAESDRLASIEANALFEAYRRGRDDLAAAREELAAYDAELARDRAATAAAAAASSELAAALERQGAALTDAFSTAGVRSLQEIRAEIQGVEAAAATLRANFEAGNISAQDFARGVAGAKVQLEGLRAEAGSIPQLTGFLERANGAILDAVNRFGALSAAMATIGFAVTPIIEANVQLDSMRRVLTQVYGSTEAANRQIDHLREVSDRAGVSFGSVTRSFTQFSVSAKTAGIDSATIQKVFDSTTLAAGNLGLSSDKVTHILEALGQMANKGTVSMEELRQQLGDSLPGALGLLAKGLGISTQQLTKLVETGQLLTKDALGPLADALVELGTKGGKPVEGLAANFGRLENAATRFYQSLNQTAAYRVLTDAVGSLAKNFDAAVKAAEVFVEVLAINKVLTYVATLGRVAEVTAVATVATEAATLAKNAETVAEVANTAAKSANTAATVANAGAQAVAARSLPALGAGAAQSAAGFGLLATAGRGLLGLFGGFPGIVALVLLNIKSLGAGIGETIAGWTASGKALENNEKKLASFDETMRAHNAQIATTTRPSIVRLTADYAQLAPVLEKAISAAEKHAKALEEEGKAAVATAQISGNHAQVLDATAAAATRSASALADVAVKQEQQAASTRNLVTAYQAQLAGSTSVTDAERQKLQTLESTLAVQEASAEQSRAAADAANIQAAAARTAQLANQDLSGSLELQRGRYENAQAAVDALSRAERLGVDVAENMKTAKLALAEAEGLYVKALSDEQAAQERAVQAAQNALRVSQAQTDTKVAASKASASLYASLATEARAYGNTAAAAQYDASAKRESITQSELEEAQIRRGIVARNASVAAVTIEIQGLRDQIALHPELTAQLQAQVDQRLADVAAMQAQNATDAQRIQQIDNETLGLQAQIDAQLKLNQAIASQPTPRAAPAAPPATGLNAGNGTNSAVNTGPVDNTGTQDVLNRAAAGTLGANDIAEVQAVLATLKQNQQADLAANKMGLITHEAFEQDIANLAKVQAILDQLQGNTSGSRGGGGIGRGNNPPPVSGPSSVDSSGNTTHTVNLNFGGGSSTSVQMASAADAAALVNALASAAARSA